MRQSKEFGQVFLKNDHFIRKIIDSLQAENKTILEIGPGEGELSAMIAQDAKALYCVELDGRYYKMLVEKFRAHPHVTVLQGDILAFDISLIPQKPIVFGNVPYHISTQLVHYLIANKSLISSVFLTLQKEFANKLIAAPGTDGYCFTTCLMQYHAEIKKIFDIPKSAFSPVPKIDSSFIHIEFFPQPKYAVWKEKLLFEIITKAFSQRRKKVTNSLHYLSRDKDFFKELGISDGWRAENLSLEHYVAITNKLGPQNT